MIRWFPVGTNSSDSSQPFDDSEGTMLRTLSFLLVIVSLALLNGCSSDDSAAKNESNEVSSKNSSEETQKRDSHREENPRSPVVRALLDTLDEIDDEGTDEERDLIRDILLDADDELADSLGDNSRRQIEDANQRLPAFQIRRRPSPTPSDVGSNDP